MNRVQTIAIRVDGNGDIGFGHLMRMKTLARAISKQGAKVVFLSKNPEYIKDFPVKVIDSTDLSSEDQNIENLLHQIQARMLIIDSYDYDQTHLDTLEQMDIYTVYIDDLNQHIFNVDLVINGNLYAPQMDYKGRSRFLLGPEYLLMREEFVGLPIREVNSHIKNVLITAGAADSVNLTIQLIERLTAYRLFCTLRWHIVIGPVFKHVSEIESLAGKITNINTYQNPKMNELMDICDICISAAGSTTYELAAAGLPAILIVTADNQLALAQEAARQGIAINLGDHRAIDNTKLYQALDCLLMNPDLRIHMVKRGQSLFDGRGSTRVAEYLLRALKQ